MGVVKLVNGLPIMQAAYDESIYYSGGLTANTNITLPNSGSFKDASAKDMMVTINDRVAEVSRDFDVVGAGPTYTQIKFIYTLSNDSVVRFKMNF